MKQTTPCTRVVARVSVSVGVRAHPDGRRSSLLDVTDTGRQAHAASEAATLDELGLRLGPLAARDLDQLGTLLAVARAHLSAPV